MPTATMKTYHFHTKPVIDVLQINKDCMGLPEKPGFYLFERTMLCGDAGLNFPYLVPMSFFGPVEPQVRQHLLVFKDIYWSRIQKS